MESKTLSAEALQVIEHYLHLPFKGRSISCPYFNNRRHGVRGALRVMIGKGTPEEIVDEAMLFGLREKIDLKKMSDDDVRYFLVDHNLGVDCSALAYYILDAELLATKKMHLRSVLQFPLAKNIVRKFLIQLRPVENAGVRTLAHEKNTHAVALADVQPGDMVTMMETGKNNDLNHVLVIHEVEYSGAKPVKLSYTHSLAWSTDGKYGHGVRQGVIEIVELQKTLLEQIWREQNKTDTENETWWRATTARSLSLRRLN